MKVLDLGCGDRNHCYKPKEDEKIVYADVRNYGFNIVMNCNKKFPFKSNTFNKVIAHNIIEHVKDPQLTLREIWRVLKSGGKADIIVPHFSDGSEWSGNIDHKHMLGMDLMETFDLKINYWCGKEQFKTTYIYLHFHKILKFIELIVNFTGFKKIYERYLCWIFPAAKLHIVAEAIKK